MSYNRYVREENYLAQGVGRIVYSYGEDYVIKIPRMRRDGGELTDFQNRMELYVWNTCPVELRHLLCPVVDSWSYKGSMVLVAQRLIVTNKEQREEVKQRTKGKNGVAMEVVRAVAEVMGGESIDTAYLKEQLVELCNIYGLVEREVMKNPANMGLTREGALKILDYGFQKQYLRPKGRDWYDVRWVREAQQQPGVPCGVSLRQHE